MTMIASPLYLKSGSPPLEVVAKRDDRVWVTWPDVTGRRHDAVFPGVCLQVEAIPVSDIEGHRD